MWHRHTIILSNILMFVIVSHPQVKSLVTFEDGKIVCVQKAVKEGQKSTKVRGNLMIIGTQVIMIMIMTII